MTTYSRQHTQGNSIVWTLDYSQWLDDAANLATATVTSSSQTLTVSTPTVLGDAFTFSVIGGQANEVATLAVQIADNLGNIKNDTIIFTVVPP